MPQQYETLIAESISWWRHPSKAMQTPSAPRGSFFKFRHGDMSIVRNAWCWLWPALEATALHRFACGSASASAARPLLPAHFQQRSRNSCILYFCLFVYGLVNNKYLCILSLRVCLLMCMQHPWMNVLRSVMLVQYVRVWMSLGRWY